MDNDIHFIKNKTLIGHLRMKSILLFLSFELLSICQVMAQNVKGKIVDGTGKPLSFANVVLLNRQDSSFVKGTISGNDGGFLIV